MGGRRPPEKIIHVATQVQEFGPHWASAGLDFEPCLGQVHRFSTHNQARNFVIGAFVSAGISTSTWP